MEEELIIIKKSKLLEFAQRFLRKFYSLYIDTLRETTLFWRRVFSSESRILTLLESDAIVLFLNTLLFAMIGTIMGSGLVGSTLFYLCGINILMFLFKVMGWIDKIIPDEIENIEDDLNKS